MGNFTGFELYSAITLNFTDVKVEGKEFIVKSEDSSAVINVNENSELAGDVISAGTLYNEGIISGKLDNSGYATSNVDNLRGAINNDGELNLTDSGALSVYVTGSGITNLEDALTLNSGAGFEGILNLDSTELTLSQGSAQTHRFGAITGNGTLNLDIDFTGDTVVAAFTLALKIQSW